MPFPRLTVYPRISSELGLPPELLRVRTGLVRELFTRPISILSLENLSIINYHRRRHLLVL